MLPASPVLDKIICQFGDSPRGSNQHAALLELEKKKTLPSDVMACSQPKGNVRGSVNVVCFVGWYLK